MHELAIIGGSGLSRMPNLHIVGREVVRTPYGEPSAPLTLGVLGDRNIWFLPRHGPDHGIPPHRVNYRANLWALRQVGARKIIGVAAVGGIRADLGPLTLAVPDQIIDYTHERQHSFFDQIQSPVVHIDFTHPYCEELRQGLLGAAHNLGEPMVAGCTYGATQGPRLETAAEIRRMEWDGCDLVGMTGMPEAALARELDLCYACCALVVNWAAGKSAGVISLEDIEANLNLGMDKVRRLLGQFVIQFSP
jgi:5'-deoxy-5'-methylthioadenosine phosphorylase